MGRITRKQLTLPEALLVVLRVDIVGIIVKLAFVIGVAITFKVKVHVYKISQKYSFHFFKTYYLMLKHVEA